MTQTEQLITKEMVNKLNREFINEHESIIRFEFKDDCSLPVVYIKLRYDPFITDETYILNPNNKFYETIESFFKDTYDIEITYNNVGSCFWNK